MILSDCQLITGGSQGKKGLFSQRHLGGASEVITDRLRSPLFFEGIEMDDVERRKRHAENHRKRYAIDLEESRRKNREKQKRYRESKKEWARDHLETGKETSRRYRLSHHEVEKAHGMAKLIPLAEKCEMCGAEAKNRHHPDYSLPRVFISVCTECHGKLHRKKSEGESA